jgi:hypothetical protein
MSFDASFIHVQYTLSRTTEERYAHNTGRYRFGVHDKYTYKYTQYGEVYSCYKGIKKFCC